MNFLIILSLFFGVLEGANFSFGTSFDNILNALENSLRFEKDFIPSLTLLNTETKSFLDHSHDTEVLQEYILAKEKAIRFFSVHPNSSFLNEEAPSVKEFIEFLLYDARNHYELFRIERIPEVLNFVLDNLSIGHNSILTDCISKLLDRLTIDLLNVFISSPKKSLAGKAYVSTLIENQIDECCALENPCPEQVLFLLTQCANNTIENSHLMKILNLLHVVNFDQLPHLFDPFFLKLRGIANGKINDMAFSEVLLNAMCIDKVAEVVFNMTPGYKDSVFFLYLTYKKFKTHCEISETEIPEKLETFYKNAFIKHVTIANCIEKLKKLKVDPTKEKIKTGCDCIFNLRKMAKEDLANLKGIRSLFDSISQHVYSLLPYHRDINGPLSSPIWEIFCGLGFLQYQLFTDDTKRKNACSNIVVSIGMLLFGNSKKGDKYPTEQVNELLPILDEVIEGHLQLIEAKNSTLNEKGLNSIMAIINLHQSEDIRNCYNDRLLVRFISKKGVTNNSYTELCGYSPTDQRGVYLTGFFTFVKDYEKDPQKSKLKHLRQFYNFIKSSGFLSKTEEKLFEAKYHSFRY